jgi:hypothetical protein
MEDLAVLLHSLPAGAEIMRGSGELGINQTTGPRHQASESVPLRRVTPIREQAKAQQESTRRYESQTEQKLETSSEGPPSGVFDSIDMTPYIAALPGGVLAMDNCKSRPSPLAMQQLRTHLCMEDCALSFVPVTGTNESAQKHGVFPKPLTVNLNTR